MNLRKSQKKRKKNLNDYNSCFGSSAEPAKKEKKISTITIAASAVVPNQLKKPVLEQD